MTPAEELQTLVYATLTEDATLTALINGVYDRAPDDRFKQPKEAYVRIGPSDDVEDDSECIASTEHTMQIDVWSRKVGFPNCKKIAGRVKALLHNTPLTLTTNALVFIRVPSISYRMDPDGLTARALMTVTAMTEEP